MKQETIKKKLQVLLLEYSALISKIDRCEGPKELIGVFQEAIKILRKADKLVEKLDDKN